MLFKKMAEDVISEKKKILLAKKQQLTSAIEVCNRRIDEHKSKRTQCYAEDSSDSDSGFPVPVDKGPSTAQLKDQASQLSVCLQATQELSSLQILESVVNVMVTPPPLLNCNDIPEGGVWREIAAECRVDLVPFSITFYHHQPSGKFSAATHHNLNVIVSKASHEKELSKSVLSTVKRPSDAVQILSSYSVAHRSRRSTLAKLSDKYGDALFMEATPEGGFQLKCANLLEISWTLQNKWSSIAPFQHRMKFDLEYMDESYIRIIKQAHKMLIDPTVDTDERTYLLTKIIDTCIEANGGYISSINESDVDTEIPDRRHTTLEQEPEMPEPKKRLTETANKDVEVMAPPKQLPKKVKKGKENVNKENRSENVVAKKPRLEDGGGDVEKNNVAKEKDMVDKKKSLANVKGGKKTGNTEGAIEKSKNVNANEVTAEKENQVVAKNVGSKEAVNKPSVDNVNKKVVTAKTSKKTSEIVKQPGKRVANDKPSEETVKKAKTNEVVKDKPVKDTEPSAKKNNNPVKASETKQTNIKQANKGKVTKNGDQVEEPTEKTKEIEDQTKKPENQDKKNLAPKKANEGPKKTTEASENLRKPEEHVKKTGSQPKLADNPIKSAVQKKTNEEPKKPDDQTKKTVEPTKKTDDQTKKTNNESKKSEDQIKKTVPSKKGNDGPKKSVIEAKKTNDQIKKSEAQKKNTDKEVKQDEKLQKNAASKKTNAESNKLDNQTKASDNKTRKPTDQINKNKPVPKIIDAGKKTNLPLKKTVTEKPQNPVKSATDKQIENLAKNTEKIDNMYHENIKNIKEKIVSGNRAAEIDNMPVSNFNQPYNGFKNTKLPVSVARKPQIFSNNRGLISQKASLMNNKGLQAQKISKIPQKMSVISESGARFKNPVRMSPRRAVGSMQQKSTEIAVRNSPRLMKASSKTNGFLAF